MREFCTKWWKRIAAVDMLFIGVLTLLASLFASWLKQFPGFSLFGALIIALLIGMIINSRSTSAYVGSNDGRKAGVKDAAGLISNKLLRHRHHPARFQAQPRRAVHAGHQSVCRSLRRCGRHADHHRVLCHRPLGVDPMLAILTAGGTGICGAAAVGVWPVPSRCLRTSRTRRDNDVTMAVAIVAIMGTVFALLEIALGR